MIFRVVRKGSKGFNASYVIADNKEDVQKYAEKKYKTLFDIEYDETQQEHLNKYSSTFIRL